MPGLKKKKTVTIYFCLSNLSERAPRTQSPRHGGKLSLQGWIANQPEMLRGSKQRLCSRSDPHRAMDLLGANVHPRKKILLTFSIHLSFSCPGPRHASWLNQMDRRVYCHIRNWLQPSCRQVLPSPRDPHSPAPPSLSSWASSAHRVHKKPNKKRH